MSLPFADRVVAGKELAAALDDYKERSHLVVLALPRGGLPVAMEIVDRLGGDLDLMIVRKLGMPGQEELAIGAIASGGGRVLNDELIQMGNVTDQDLEAVTQKERRELERRAQTYRGERPWPDLKGATVLLVDDGLATGATMRAALESVKEDSPREVVVAVPVAPRDTIDKLRALADDVVCLETPEPFTAIGRWYRRFDQVSDDEVREMLNRAWGA